MRFKCVSKSFKTVISSPDFTKLHLRHSPSQFLILPGNGRIKCYDIDSATATASTTFPLSYGGPISILGSVNGVLCILPNAINKSWLLNPATGTYRIIPPDFNMKFSGVRESSGFSIGFAFDHENQDFKIVGVSNGNLQDDVIKTRVTKVYSLNNNSWTELERLENQDSIIKYPGGTLSNTHLLHWMSWSHSSGKQICCFDACKNRWVDDVLLPHYYYDSSENVILLEFGVLDDRLFSSFERVGHGNDV